MKHYTSGSALRAQSLLWEARFDDQTVGSDRISAATVDDLGNSYLAGVNDTGWTAWKLSADGNVVWQWHGPGLGNINYMPSAISLDAAGNAYVVGKRWDNSLTVVRVSPDGHDARVGRLDAPGDNLEASLVTPGGEIFATGSRNGTVLTVKMAADGNIVWAVTYNPATPSSRGRAIAIGPDGSVYVAGTTRPSAVPPIQGYDLILLRYSPLGELVWATRFEVDPQNPIEVVRPTRLTIDSNGNAYVVGLRTIAAQQFEILTMKFSATGAPLWHDGFVGPQNTSNERSPELVWDESTETPYVAGETSASAGNADLVLLRYDSQGQRAWVATYDGPAHGNETLANLAIDAAGSIHVTATSDGEDGDDDMLFLQFDSAGQQQVAERYDSGPAGDDSVLAAAVDRAGNTIAAGWENNGNVGYGDNRFVRFANGEVAWSFVAGTMVRIRQ